jgi:CBS domain-containing protein
MLASRGVRRAPVIDGAGALVGMVTLDDLLPAIAQQLRELADTAAPDPAHLAHLNPEKAAGAVPAGRDAEVRLKVGDLCDRKPVTVSISAPASDAAQLMCQQLVGAVVVTAAPADGTVAVGMLTDRDIVCAQLDRAGDLGQLRIGDIMTGDPLVLNEDLPVEDAIRRLRSRHVRRAPVIGSKGELVGVISFDDLLAHVSGNLGALARLAEARSRPPRHERRPGYRVSPV